MIRYIRIRPLPVIILCVTLNLPPLAHLHADENPVKVAFIGVYFDGLNEKSQDKISNDFLAMLQLEPSLAVTTPDEVERLIGSGRVKVLLKENSKDSLFHLAALLEVDHVFAAKVSNESKDTNQVILVGSFSRYDRWTGASYSYSILKFYQNFHEDLKLIKEQFVTSILPRKETILSKWPFFVVAGLAVIGIFFLLFTKTTGGEDDRPPGDPTES
ncbi:MAG: hypothetical protein HY562_04160 [Ignavibacteriales bacterium]|nr:hypothetical protein [Ignavibacteriales bacterium]